MSRRKHVEQRRGKSLDQLEGRSWGEPDEDATDLVRTSHGLRHKPIGEFTTEDLRVMVGQQIGLLFLVPLALEVVESDPLAEGDFYPGDLLGRLLCVPKEFWAHQTDLRNRLDAAIAQLLYPPDEIRADLNAYRTRRD